MVRNKNNVFISLVGVILLLIIFIIPKNLTLKTLILSDYIDFTNMIMEENDKEININDKEIIDSVLNNLKNVKIKKINDDIEKLNKIELRFFSQDNPKSISFNIYDDKYIEIISSIEGDYNKNKYELLQGNDLNNIIKEIKKREIGKESYK